MPKYSTTQGRHYHLHFIDEEIEDERFHLCNRVRIKIQVIYLQNLCPFHNTIVTFQISRERKGWVD